MRHYFLDASAAVKAYVDEPGHERIRDLLRSATTNPPTARLFICDLCLPEVASALSQKRGAIGPGRLTRATYYRLFQRACVDLHLGAKPDFVFVLASDVMDTAARVVDRRELRSGDAVQLSAALAAAQTVREAFAADFVFVAADRKLLAAAAAEGLAIEDPA